MINMESTNRDRHIWGCKDWQRRGNRSSKRTHKEKKPKTFRFLTIDSACNISTPTHSSSLLQNWTKIINPSTKTARPEMKQPPPTKHQRNEKRKRHLQPFAARYLSSHPPPCTQSLSLLYKQIEVYVKPLLVVLDVNGILCHWINQSGVMARIPDVE